jgi:hypothetical protein
MAALSSADKLDELIAREEIRDLIYRYSHAIDRRDWAALDAIFWPDGLVAYGLYDDRAGGFTPVVKQVYAESGIRITQHFIGNCILRVTGDSACGETYVQALHQVPNGQGGFYDLLMASRYLDKFERRAGEWRIAFRKVAFDWLRQFADSGDWNVGAFGIKRGAGHISEPEVEPWADIQAQLPARP